MIRTALVLLPLLLPRPTHPPTRPELLFYMTGSDASFASFKAHAADITVVAPQVFAVDSLGVVWGHVDPRVLEIAHRQHVRVVPLVVNAGFSQPDIHRLLHDPGAAGRAIHSLVRLAAKHGFDGWQLDFEHIAMSDRDALTAFVRRVAAALHARGRTLSVAVVPWSGEVATSPYAAYMEKNWRGAYDAKALADAADFISLMTYAQHGGSTGPGPVAGLPWMERMLDAALKAGVPRAKLSLGLPSYSGYWHTTWDARAGAHEEGQDVGFERASALLRQGGATTRWLPAIGESLAHWSRSGTWEWMFLEDRRAFAARLDLLQRYPGLRGISVWVLGTEDPGIWTEIESRYGRR